MLDSQMPVNSIRDQEEEVLSYEDKLGFFVEANWSMGRDDVIGGVCSWGKFADMEIADLKEKLGMLQIHSDHTETLLKSCETALSSRDDQLANSIPKERVEALIEKLDHDEHIRFVGQASMMLRFLVLDQPINKGGE